jgi:predicted metalloprotease
MPWQNERRSENVDYRRGIKPARIALGGGIGTLVLVLIAAFLGADPRRALNLIQNDQQVARGQMAAPADPEEGKLADFVKVVLGETGDVWTDVFRKMNKVYKEPTLVMFTGAVQSQCGTASAAVGSFYCPGDQQVYIDLALCKELQNKFKAPGEFAEAYVIAHEVGHHVQNLLGISDRVHAEQSRMSKEEADELTVRLELQADFLAGVWAYHLQNTRRILDAGDLDDGLRAAAAIGDDKLQMEAQGYVVPDSFTHGTSRQRVRWFHKGYQSGRIEVGDTFGADDL